MLHEMRRRWIRIVPVVLLAAATAGCHGEVRSRDEPEVPERPAPRPVSGVTQAIRAFPCDSASLTEMPRGLARNLTDTDSIQANEVHDCQKLVVNGQFGPLVAIYPLPSVSWNNPASFDTPRPVATVFNWGPDRYAPLGIERDWNCVWLSWDRRTDRWSAFMARPFGDACADPDAMPPESRDTLVVKRYTHKGTAQYPATARWGWDETNRVHHVGIKCAAGWCFLGPEGFVPRDTILGQGGVHEVPGWYDDQHLAIPGRDGKLVPGPWGRIHPAPDLGRLNADRLGVEPRVIGYVTLSGTPQQLAHYDSTWNFRRGRNTLLVSREGAQWFMTVRPDGAASARFRIDRETGAMHAVQGAVRWRWDSTDESIWFGCDGACCTPALR